jgi:hypothetical protein
LESIKKPRFQAHNIYKLKAKRVIKTWVIKRSLNEAQFDGNQGGRFGDKREPKNHLGNHQAAPHEALEMAFKLSSILLLGYLASFGT